MIFDFTELEEHCKQIAETFNSSLEKQVDYNFYGIYYQALQKAVSLGYNSSIICPIMTGSPTEWANFQLVLMNEITRFTSIVKKPACLISGGPFDSSDDRNKKFIQQIATGLNREHPLSVMCTSSSQAGFIANYEIFTDELSVTDLKHTGKKNNNNGRADRELDLRVVLIPDFDSAKIKLLQN